MGLTISYDIRLARRSFVPAFFAAARTEARSHGWVVRRSPPGQATLEFLPHKECEPVRLDFCRSPRCEAFVKTSAAPLKTHVQIVDFLRALQPHAKSICVEDECEYWETGDLARLTKHRRGWEVATGKKAPKKFDKPMVFTLNAVVVRTK